MIPTGIALIPTGIVLIPTGIVLIPTGIVLIPVGITPILVGIGAIPRGLARVLDVHERAAVVRGGVEACYFAAARPGEEAPEHALRL